MADSALNLYAYQDAVDRLVDYLGGSAEAAASRDIRRAILEAYDEITLDREWSHFTRVHYETLQAPASGTCSYSASTNQFTIDTGSWPTWAEGATLSIGDNRYRVASRDSGTELTPSESTLPVDDIDTGTAFTIFKDVITLPQTYKSLVEPLYEGSQEFARYVPPEEWVFYTRYDDSTGSPLVWTIMADPIYVGRQAIHLYPAPDANVTLGFIGRFYPRSLKFTGHGASDRAGLVTLSSNSITGSGTSFTSDMVGSLIRVSPNSSDYPEGPGGDVQYQHQRIIDSYSSATALTFKGDTVSAATRRYVITDPLDMNRSMLNAFWRLCEKLVAYKKGSAAQAAAEQQYAMAIAAARNADSGFANGKVSCWNLRPRGIPTKFGEDDLT